MPLPAHWRTVQLGDYCKVQTGCPFKSEGFDERKGTPLIRVRSLKTQSCDIRFNGEYDDGFLVENDSVLIGMDGDFQPCVWAGGTALLNQRVCRLKDFSADLQPYYAYLALKKPLQELEDTTHFTTVKHLSASTIQSIEIPMPPIQEQRAIAHVLKTLQKAKEARQRELALEHEQKATLAALLFTAGMNGYAPRNGKDLPQGWELVELGDLIQFGPQNGIYKPQSLYGTGTAIVRIDDFDNEGNLTSPVLQRVRLSSDETDLYRLSDGDLLVNRVNSLSHLGKSLFVRNIGDVTVFESNMMRFRVDESRVLGVFLAQYLLCERVKAHVRGRAKRAVAQSSINQGDVRSIPVPLPSVREQEQIVTILGACVQKLMAVQREIELLDELFSVLLIELMNGGRSVSYLASQGIPR